MKNTIRLILIGGSWGGIQASINILKYLPEDYKIPIVLILHRMKNFESELEHLLGNKIALKVKQIEDKQEIIAGTVYVAPPNYHVLVELDKRFSLDDSELENYSRPSIDVTFRSAASVYGTEVAGIILSGANKDGSLGLAEVALKGGIAVSQDPREAEMAIMPIAAIDKVPGCQVLSLDGIKDFLLNINDQ